ncbi:hypothetical protein HN018_22160 (plasmid) [Lichenicola cladoniae]|uniref:Tyr recombinase domain-containing protein n=1 Tax=Lichenicola cladoniae TaxID=1484109 RepID=A0A6M8HX61_9PROT|nr:hypothetical protein [Lichenicola cladoniae]NPD69851.1 hypothetical protein [Acetobacteraceae bacterium]QKE92930.1 hypothetical protein HN018_22160 [Lichenicola cladoniae]
MSSTGEGFNVAAVPASARSVLSPETQRVYAGAWRDFCIWRTGMGLGSSLPVPAEHVVAHIERLMPAASSSTVKLRLASIALHSNQPGSVSCTAHAAVRAALRRCQRAAEGSIEQAVVTQLACCGEDLAGLRDRAVLLMNHVGGLAPADIAGLDREDLEFRNTEVVVRVRLPNAPVEEPGQPVHLPRRHGDPFCPAVALERWLQRSGILYGAIFQGVTVHGTLDRRLGVVGVRRILQRIETQAAAQAMPTARPLVPATPTPRSSLKVPLSARTAKTKPPVTARRGLSSRPPAR